MRTTASLLLLPLSLCTQVAFAQPSVTPLYIFIRPETISGDGHVIGGSTASFPVGHAAYWVRNGQLVDLGVPAGFATAKVVASNWDGSVLTIIAIGSSETISSWLWTQATGMVPITVPNTINAQASCISRDGSVVAGSVINPTSHFALAMRWTMSDGGSLVPQGSNYSSWIHALSPTGTHAVGSGTSGDGTQPMVWQTTADPCDSLGTVPGATGGIAFAMTPDSSTVVGNFFMPGNEERALIWTSQDGISSLSPPAGFIYTELHVISDDGLLAGGYVSSMLGDGGTAVLWRRGAGLILANDYFAARGINTSTLNLNNIVAVSANGRVICDRRALIDLGACGSADFNHDGDSATDADIEDFFACLSGNCCPLCDTADFNGDGDVATDADIEAFFRVLAGGSC